MSEPTDAKPAESSLAEAKPAEAKPAFRSWDTTIARGVAALLIVNSHLERFYPIPWLADGGQIGNLGFFFISGLGLGLSKRSEDSFFGWCRRRFSRIFPTVWFCLIPTAVLINGGWKTWGLADYFERLVWPIEGYHFLERILLYYVVLYFLLAACKQTKALLWVLAANVAAVLAISVLVPPNANPAGVFQLGSAPESYKWTFYFSAMLTGIVLGRSTKPENHSWKWLLGGTVLCAIGYLVLKFLIVVKQTLTEWYAVQGYITLLLCVLAVMTLAHPVVSAAIKRVRWLDWAMGLVGAASLELYLLHFQLLHMGRPHVWLPFPFNAVLFLLISVAASVGAHFALKRIMQPARTKAA